MAYIKYLISLKIPQLGGFVKRGIKMKIKINKKAVGLRIKQIRMNKGYTLEEFGKFFDTGKSNVYSWEQGTALPNKERIKQITKFADITINELLYGKELSEDDFLYGEGLKEINGKLVNKKAVGNKIFEIRSNMDLTLEEFGKLFDAAKSVVLRWENGSSLPNKSRIEKIAKKGNLTVDELLHGSIEEFTKIQALEKLEEYLVKIKKLSTVAGIDFADHYEAMYNQWRLEYGRERRKESE